MPLPNKPVTEWSEAFAVMDIADLVRREGNRIYGSCGLPEGVYQSMLCGLVAAFKTGGVIHSLKAHDIDVSIRLEVIADVEDDGIERNSPVRTRVCLDYLKGNAATLAAWHQDLCAYRQSMRVSGREISAA